MIIAVTGANGHVGVNLCKKLISMGHHVRALVHVHDQPLKDFPVTIYKGNLLEKESLVDLVKGAEIIFHLAARISIDGDPDGSIYRMNTEGTHNLAELGKEYGVRRFIHFSSIHAFQQSPHDIPLDESRQLVTEKAFAYDRSKAEGERIVLRAAAEGLDAVVICPTAITGPMDPEPGLLGQAFLQIYHGKIPALVPGGYDMVDVRDVVDGAIAAMEKGRTGEKYLLSGKWHSIREISVLIEELTGVKTVKKEMPFIVAQIGLPFITLYSRLTGTVPLYTSESLQIIMHANRNISNKKAVSELDFAPRDIRTSVKDLFEWFDTNNYLKKS